MDTAEQPQPNTGGDLSPECKLVDLVARWTVEWDRDPFSNETAILGNKVLQARAGLPLDEKEPPYGYQITVTQRYPHRTNSMTHREQVLGVNFQKPAGGILKKVHKLGGTAAAIVRIAKS